MTWLSELTLREYCVSFVTSKFKSLFFCSNVSHWHYLFRFRTNVDWKQLFIISSWLRNFYQPFLRVCTYHFKFYMSAMLSSASKRKGIWDKPHQSRPQQTSLLYPINPSGFLTIWHRQAIRAKWTLAFGLTCETKTFLGNFRIFLLLVRDKQLQYIKKWKEIKRCRAIWIKLLFLHYTGIQHDELCFP